MNSSAAAFRPRHDFDAFLFALVGEDKSGMPLSVISVLGRADLDPWQAAAQLAALSPDSAAQKLVAILGALTIPSLQSSDIRSIAGRLVAMLPRQSASLTAPLRALSGSAGTTVPRPHADMRFLAIYLLLMVAAQFLLGHLLPTQADAPPAPVSSSAPALVSPAPAAK